MARTKQPPNKYGIRQSQSGPARQPTARRTRSNMQMQLPFQPLSPLRTQSSDSPQQPATTRQQSRSNTADAGAEVETDAQQELAVHASSAQEGRGLDMTMLEPIDVTDRPEEDEGSGTVHDDDPESDAVEPTEAAETIDATGATSRSDAAAHAPGAAADDSEEVNEAKTTAGANKTRELDIYDFDYVEPPSKRRRVTESHIPAIRRSAPKAGRRKSVAYTVHAMTSGMAKASPKRASPQQDDAANRSDEAGEDGGDAEMAATDDEPNGQTQERDITEVAHTDDDDDDDGSDDDGDNNENQETGQQQAQNESTQASPETQLTNGTGSAYAVSEASEAGSEASKAAYVPPVTKLPPRKSAANPTVNVPSAARFVVKDSVKPGKQLAVATGAPAAPTQGVKRKRGRPRKIVEPITTQPITTQTITTQPGPIGRPRNIVKPITTQPITTQPIATQPSQPPKVVDFPSDVVASIVALMSRDGWTGQSMWKGTFRWYHEDLRRSQEATSDARRLSLQLWQLDEAYRAMPALTKTSNANVLARQSSVLESRIRQWRSVDDDDIEYFMIKICDMLCCSVGIVMDDDDRGDRAADKDPATARRVRATAAGDLVSRVLPALVLLLETLCCMGGSTPDEAYGDASFRVPSDTVRITELVWQRLNKVAYWLLKMENALAHELGYRDDHDLAASGVGLGLGLGLAPNPDVAGTGALAVLQASNIGLAARNRSMSSDRARLRPLLNKLQDDLCRARINFERAVPVPEPRREVQQQQQQRAIDLPQAERVLGATTAPVANAMDTDEDMHADLALTRINESLKAREKTPTPETRRPEYYSPPWHQESSSPSSPGVGDDSTVALYSKKNANTHRMNSPASRSRTMRVILPAQLPTSARTEVARVDEAADAVEERVHAPGTAQEMAKETASNDAPRKSVGAAAAAEPKRKIFTIDWDDDDDDDDDSSDLRMTRALPSTAAGDAPGTAEPDDDDSQESTIFMKPHAAVPVAKVPTTKAADVPATQATDVPAAESATPATPAAKPSTTAAKGAVGPVADSQDTPSSRPPYTRADRLTILSILRTKKGSFNIAQLAEELGRNVDDVAFFVYELKKKAQDTARRENKPVPAWARVGKRFNM